MTPSTHSELRYSLLVALMGFLIAYLLMAGMGAEQEYNRESHMKWIVNEHRTAK
jgi:hypothetical protein